jgi:N-acetylglucosaminyldiphosphoundecaprenol N-acetyl-beta-D-mannosaminyltransferase
MPVVWAARLIGVPVNDRIAGSDIFEALKRPRSSAEGFRLFLFGGARGVTAMAGSMLNAEAGALKCVGSLFPGFGSVDDMSADDIIATVNASGADFLMAALGARKGQAWLLRNRRLLQIPIRAHFGAALNFQAGTVKRAPTIMRTIGLEWLWRIKEEPSLWRRYWHDGWALARLLLTSVFPLAFASLWMRWACRHTDLHIRRGTPDETLTLVFSGAAVDRYVNEAVICLREVAAKHDRIVIDLSETRFIDARFFGLFLMLRKFLNERNGRLKFVGLSRPLERLFRLSGVDYLLSGSQA